MTLTNQPPAKLEWHILSPTGPTGSAVGAVKPQAPARWATITLCRPDKANAFDDGMINSLIGLLDQVASETSTRLLVLRGEGSHFCAGADLEWMKKSASLGFEENLKDAALLKKLFTSLKTLPIPTLGLVQGSVMGGGVGLVACLDTVIALKGSRFALSEVKLGLAPAVILPFLFQKMQSPSLRTYALTGQVFSAEEAIQSGLVTFIADPQEAEADLQKYLEMFMTGGPLAQREIKHFLNLLDGSARPEDNTLLMTDWGVSLIARLRTSVEGQAGLQAFFNKSDPPWKVRTPLYQVGSETSPTPRKNPS